MPPFTTIFCPITLFAIIYCCLATDPHEASEPFQQFMKQSALLKENGSKSQRQWFFVCFPYLVDFAHHPDRTADCDLLRYSKNKHVRGV
uniref:Secreted protein n=1 Tax=Globodera pallida TaxID=36090 RepID=A0A183BX05_GLOPA